MKVVLDSGAYVPQRAYDTDAGYDVRTPVCVTIPPGESRTIDTGVHIGLPHGTCAVVISKSGLCINRDIVSTGLIDEGFTGSIKIKLWNLGSELQRFMRGDKIGQFVVLSYHDEPIEIVYSLPKTDRADNGYGSTGR